MAAPTESAAKKAKGYQPGISEDDFGLDGLPQDIVVTSPCGGGKTHLAGTWSEDWPESGEGAPGSMTILNDIAWLRADKGAINTLISRRIKPRYSIDMIHLLTPVAEGEADRPVASDYLEALQWVSAELKYLSKKGVRKLVVDTISTLQLGVTAYWMAPERMDGGGKYAAWDKIKVTMYRFWQECNLNGFRVCWLAHPITNQAEVATRDAPKGASAAQQAASVVGSTPGENLIVPGVQGQTRNLIVGNACLQLWLKADDIPGKGFKRSLMPYGGEGAQGKHRYHNILSREEPADLRALEAKITAHIKGGK